MSQQNPLIQIADERLSRTSLEKPTLVDESDPDHKPLQDLPNMWSLNYIGLYSQYAAVGLLYGSTGALLPFCVYVYDGPSNVCANAKNIVTFAWNIKIFFAILTDTYRPFGMRRKPWMIAGWVGVLLLLLVLTATAHEMSISAWLVTLMLVQGFAILSDVPADGYSVEIASLEKEHEKGQILATGQRVRFSFCIVAGNGVSNWSYFVPGRSPSTGSVVTSRRDSDLPVERAVHQRQ
jgi:MFS family permease